MRTMLSNFQCLGCGPTPRRTLSGFGSLRGLGDYAGDMNACAVAQSACAQNAKAVEAQRVAAEVDAQRRYLADRAAAEKTAADCASRCQSGCSTQCAPPAAGPAPSSTPVPAASSFTAPPSMRVPPGPSSTKAPTLAVTAPSTSTSLLRPPTGVPSIAPAPLTTTRPPLSTTPRLFGLGRLGIGHLSGLASLGEDCGCPTCSCGVEPDLGTPGYVAPQGDTGTDWSKLNLANPQYSTPPQQLPAQREAALAAQRAADAAKTQALIQQHATSMSPQTAILLVVGAAVAGFFLAR